MSTQFVTELPAHVPSRLVFDFDFFSAPQGKKHPQAEVARSLFSGAPDIFFSPRNGGQWVVTRFADGEAISKRFEDFSNDAQYDAARPKYPRNAPVDYDPPEHTDLRRIMNKAFTPKALHKITTEIDGLAGSLIDAVLDKGRCEFVEEISRQFSVNIFLNLAAAPMRDRDRLLAIAHEHVRVPGFKARIEARRKMGEYLAGLIAERRKAPGDDLVSLLLQSRMPDRDLTADEELGLVTLTFFGGLDSVVSMLSFIMLYLARHPEEYEYLKANPQNIDRALEELIRAHAVNNTARGVKRDCEYGGIEFHAHDRMVLLRPVMGFDDRQIADAYDIRLDRAPVPHMSFGAGPHRCAGAHLARMEMKSFLQQWIKRIPAFKPVSYDIVGGHIWSPKTLDLSWA